MTPPKKDPKEMLPAIQREKMFLKQVDAFDEPRNFTELMAACDILVASKILPKEIDTKEKAAVVILTGRELGLRMMASTRTIYVVNQKPALSAQVMLALAHKTGELENYELQETGSGESAKCTMTVKRKGKKPYTCSFSVEEAKKMQKYANEWMKQPETMCRSRAISKNLRVTFPDAILGLYTPEETEYIVAAEEAGVEDFMPKPKLEADPAKKAPVEPTIAKEAQPGSDQAQEIRIREGYDALKAIEDGKCKACKQPYKKGDTIAFSKTKGLYHPDCAE